MTPPHSSHDDQEAGELLCESSLDDEERHVSLCEALDRVLDKGAVLQGDIMISVADVDLLYLGLRIVLTSIERAMRAGLTLPGREVCSGADG
jgi:hypothetical protein